MSDSEILEKLLEFEENLSLGMFIVNIFRWMMWIFIKGLAWIVDQLENITDQILLLKGFYNDPAFAEFVNTIKPVLVVLFALNLLFIGYLLILQKKFDREGVLINVVMALAIIILLGSGMGKVDKFTDSAVSAIKSEEEEGTLASEVLQKNIRDISLYDLDGWTTPDLEEKNNLETEFVTDININSYLAEGVEVTKDNELSEKGVSILTHKVETLGDGSRKIMEIESGDWITKITKEYYYRYTVNWFTTMVTLGIMAFVLISVSIKMAKLFFELAFNYLIAGIVAPLDMHSGQKIKTIIQNILSIFAVVIMIFLSLKVYMIGTVFIADKLEGIPYLIAMVGFAMAVIDGPNIVERLFGLDAGLKSGWGTLVGGYALAKGATAVASGTAKGVAKGASALAGGTAGMVGMAKGLKGSGNNANISEQSNDQNKDKDKDKSKHSNQSEQSNEVEKNQEQVSATSDTSDTSQKNEESKQKPSIHQEMIDKGYDVGQQNEKREGITQQGGGQQPNRQGGGNGYNGGTSYIDQGSGGRSNGSGGSSSGGSGSIPVTPISSGASPTSGIHDASPGASPTSNTNSDVNTTGGGNSGGNEPETRTFGEIMKNKVESNKTYQNVKRNYQVGKNTGASIRNNRERKVVRMEDRRNAK